MKLHALLPVALVLAVLPACRVIPETGRRQFALFPESQMAVMGAQAYEQETGQYQVITSGKDYEMVQRLGKRIAAASGLDASWEFRLLEAPDVVNAFALPGGKVAIYTGILPVTQNEDGLAAVVGHEVAHVTARHGNERMTQGYMQAGLMIGAQTILDWNEVGDTQQQLWMAGLGLGSELGVKKYSRDHESEADEIGLRYLVRAGYDPNEAPRLWERMAKMSGGGGGDFLSQLLSTHPDPLARAERLRELIPKVVAEEGR